MPTTFCVAPTLLQQQDAFASLRHTQTSSSLEFEFHNAQSPSSTSALISQLANSSPQTSYFPPSASTSLLSSHMPPCILVSVSGGQAAGKKTVQAAIAKRLKELSGGRLRITCLSMGDFARRLDENEREEAMDGKRDMDCIGMHAVF